VVAAQRGGRGRDLDVDWDRLAQLTDRCLDAPERNPWVARRGTVGGVVRFLDAFPRGRAPTAAARGVSRAALP
jgi:hypothetical protein